MKKIVSMVLTVVVLMTSFAAVSVSATDEAPEMITVYDSYPIDLSAAANAKFYIDPTTESSFDTDIFKLNFLFGPFYNYTSYAAKWPLSLRARAEGSTYPAQKAKLETNTSGIPVLTSTQTDVVYNLPAKGTGTSAKEVILLDTVRKNSYGWSSAATKDVALSGKYDSLNFLVAVAHENTTTRNTTLQATVTYSGGETVTLAAEPVAVPGSSDVQQSASDNFVADIVSLTSTNGTSATTATYAEKTPGVGTPGNSNPIYTTIALYEYSIALDPEMELSSINFTEASKGLSGVAILAVTGVDEKMVEKPKVAYVDENVDLSSYATAKLWVSLEDSGDILYYDRIANASGTGYNRYYKNFITGGDDWDAPVRFPLAVTTNSNVTVLDDGSVSKVTKIKAADGTVWTLPKKTAVDGTVGNAPYDTPEAIIFSYYGGVTEATVDINKNYNSFKFLLAGRQNGINKVTLNVYGKYEGKDEELLKTIVPSKVNDTDILYTDLTKVLDMYVGYNNINNSSYTTIHDGTNWKSTSTNQMFECVVESDVTKVLETVRFEAVYSGATSEKFAVVSMIGERTATDYERVYNSVELGSAANSKFYIDPTDETEATGTTYHKKNFLGADGYSPNSYAAAKWPLNIRTREEGSAYPAQDGYFAESDAAPVIVSQNSGVTYTLPAKKEGSGAEIILLDEKRHNSWSYSGQSTKTVNISGNFEGIHFLVATARPTACMTLQATATYTNGDTALLNTEATLIPGANEAQQTANANFVADFDSLVHYSASNAADAEVMTFETPRFDTPIALYEYSIDLDVSKTLQSITFTENRSGASNYLVGLGIVAITTEGVSTDNADTFLSASAVTVEDGACIVNASSPFESTLYVAVYNKADNRLIGVKSLDVEGTTHGAEFRIESDEITADGEYDVKLFMWHADGSFAPITASEAL